MNLEETGRVLAKAAAFDRRTVGASDVLAWHETVVDLDVTDALAAVSRWYRDRSDWLMPAHLRETIALIRAEEAKRRRIARAESIGFPVEAARRPLSDLPTETQAALRSAASGNHSPECDHPDEDRKDLFGGGAVCGRCGRTLDRAEIQARRRALLAAVADEATAERWPGSGE